MSKDIKTLYYILLVSKVGRQRERGILRPQFSDTEFLPGSLLYVKEGQTVNSQQNRLYERVDAQVDAEVECLDSDVESISNEDLLLLLAIPICSERIVVYQNKEWLNEGRTLRVGDYVLVTLKGYPDLTGVIRFKGELKEPKGIQFGVELDEEHHGKGTSEGIFRKQRYFTCPNNCGVFVPLHKIRRDLHRQERVHGYAGASAGAHMVPEIPLKVGDRIVWMSDTGPEHGVVKWIGILPDAKRRDEPTVGVEFDNPVGSGTGKYKNVRLFTAKAQHASLVPALGLMREDDLRPSEKASAVYQQQEQLLNEAHKKKMSQSYPTEAYSKLSRDSFEAQRTAPSSGGSGGSLSRRTSGKSSNTIDSDLAIDSVVEVMSNPPLYGVIRWIGTLPEKKDQIIAGLEMEEEISAGTDGTFGSRRLFTCPAKKAFFVPLYKCRKDKRFLERNSEQPGSSNFGTNATPDVEEYVSIPDIVSEQDVKNQMCGKERGIQGHHNSCYLDATLFAMFFFTHVFEVILHRPKQKDDIPEYDEVISVMKKGIVYPLRKYNYVRADKVMKLRQLLHKLGNIPGMLNEEKDPEEFLNLLLGKITKADPFLHIRSEMEKEKQHTYLYQLFMEKDERLSLPTTQQLFELSFLQMGIKLQEIPSCLILQMPRFGKDYKMYKRIVPSLELDISDVMDFEPRECIICGDLARYECKRCYNTHGAGLNTIAFCEGCKKTSHQHKNRTDHEPQKISVRPEFEQRHAELKKNITNGLPNIPRVKMELFAVICIQTSHYVSFVKCGQGTDAPWVFFDSMADRMGEQSGYNIPEVKFCDNLTKWLSDDYHGEVLKREEDKDLPEQIRRLICDAYVCMYQHPDVSKFQ